MSVDLKIGAKVVCINDDWAHPLKHLAPQLPVKNRVYTIREFEPFWEDRVFLRVVELVNPVNPPYGEAAFAAGCFRPLVARPTDISIFERLLTPATRKLEKVP